MLNQITPEVLRQAAEFSRQTAYRAIMDASGKGDHVVSAQLAVAAQKLRDADTFDGHANMLELTEPQE